MKIAIIGTGISGLTAAHTLHPEHEVTLFEAANYIGGHTHTVDVTSGGQNFAVDTGFIVFNHRTYPNFKDLLAQLNVPSQPSEMSFSVKCEQSGLEYNGTNLNSLFSQRKNLLSPRFWGMLRDILRFNKQVKALLAEDAIKQKQLLGPFLVKYGYGHAFIDQYIVPMGSAIWSAGKQQMLLFPLKFFADFFNNHGMLNVNDRPQWRVVKNGSRAYVEALVKPFLSSIKLNTPVTSVRRLPHGVSVSTASGNEVFDEVVMAVHSDQALRLLADPSREEMEILGAMDYQRNEAVLHTDTSILPHNQRAWAAWNYHILNKHAGRVAVTYNMNILQNLAAQDTFCVTLNHSDAINPDRIIDRYVYHHPIFSYGAVRAQERHHQISDVRRTHYCGAYWSYGFHEDGVNSGMRVAKAILARPPVHKARSA